MSTKPRYGVFYIKQGDLLPVIQVSLTDANGPIDLTSVTDVKFRMSRPGSGMYRVDAAAQVVDATTGLVQYVWATGDTSDAGVYEVDWLVTFSSGKPQSFPNDGFSQVTIQEQFP